MKEIRDYLNRMYIPTLRIIMTSVCNGECFFCHKEGNTQCKKDNQYMDLDIIKNEIVPAINLIGINKVIFTGGEPTMCEEIATAIRMVKVGCENVQVGITTNGFNLERIQSVKNYLDRITVSISSLKEEVFMRYTKLNPLALIDNLESFDKIKKSVSIVITRENINEMEELIELCINRNFDVKLQFIISDIEKDDINWRRKILYRFMEKYGDFHVKLESTPVLCKKINGKELKIKLASLNNWMYDNLISRDFCLHCEKKSKCVERGCAVRVFPDGKVTPCLNQIESFSSDSVLLNLKKAYYAMGIQV